MNATAKGEPGLSFPPDYDTQSGFFPKTTTENNKALGSWSKAQIHLWLQTYLLDGDETMLQSAPSFMFMSATDGDDPGETPVVYEAQLPSESSAQPLRLYLNQLNTTGGMSPQVPSDNSLWSLAHDPGECDTLTELFDPAAPCRPTPYLLVFRSAELPQDLVVVGIPVGGLPIYAPATEPFTAELTNHDSGACRTSSKSIVARSAV